MPNPKGRTSDRLLTNARALRRDMTDAEQRLWRIVRDRRLVGVKFRRQVPVAGYVLDFYCPERSLAVELDGGQHNESDALAYDGGRSAELASRGITVLRFWNNVVLREPDVVTNTIVAALRRQGASSAARPHPGGVPPVPLPEGEGEGHATPSPARPARVDRSYRSHRRP